MFLILYQGTLTFAAFRPFNKFFLAEKVDNMKVIVVHVLPQRVGHGAVALVGVHDCRQDVLLAAHNFDCSFVGIGVKLFCKVIAAVVEEVRGINVEDQLSEFLSIRFQTAGGNHAVGAHLFKQLLIPGGWCFEMDVILCPFVNDKHTHTASIEIQQLIIARYLEQNPEIIVVQTYIDNGATGTNLAEVR